MKIAMLQHAIAAMEFVIVDLDAEMQPMAPPGKDSVLARCLKFTFFSPDPPI